MSKREMVRNINTDFIYQQMEIMNISPKELCIRLGRGDSYLGAIKRNGMPKKELGIMAAWLEVEEKDPRLFVGGTPLTDENIEQDTTITNWSVRDSNELHKIRSDVAELRRVIYLIANEVGVSAR